jgi:hypothetical protein
MVWSTIVIVLVVAVFLFTFVIPIAQDQREGFVAGSNPPFVSGPYSTNKKINDRAIEYVSNREVMINNTNNLYNNLSSAMNPLLPAFFESSPDAAELNNIKKSINSKIPRNLTAAENRKLTTQKRNLRLQYDRTVGLYRPHIRPHYR